MKKKFFNEVVNIPNKKIGKGQPTFIIAEAGVNHFGSLKKAKKLVDLAVESKADAYKLQVFKTENLISKMSEEWIDRLKPKELAKEEVIKIKEYCDKKKIIFFATGHDMESLDFLEKLNVPAFKIGSGEINNLLYIKYVAEKKKPVIISTGMYTEEEIYKVLETFKETKNKNICLLHCVTCYPTPMEHANLRFMSKLINKLNLPVGYSDHTIGIEIPLAAVALGAKIIEKHITLDRNISNAQDWIVSADAKEMKLMVNSIRNIEKSLGSENKQLSELEIKSKKWARKSIVAKKFIPKNKLIKMEDICFKRPGTGIAPDDFGRIIDRKAKRNIEEDTIIDFNDVS